MNIRTLRMKNGKRAVTPVIATIILIAATIVLALVVGAYTFGLFGSNVKTVTLSSATLYGGTTNATAGKAGTTYLAFALNNPGSSSSISSLTLTSAGIQSISVWQLAAGTVVAFSSACPGTSSCLTGGQVSSYTFYASSPLVGGTVQTVTTGQVYNYVINFANGQSVSGSLIAQ